MRLNKYLAHATGMSRREADNLIAASRVRVNNAPVELGLQVEDSDIVTVDGKKVTQSASHTYLMFNKPVGYLCSRRSQGGVPTIFELLPEKYRPLKPVGRLDKDSSGLILLTDDGDFAHRMTHPSFHKVKVYEVELDRPLEPLHQQMISEYGVQLEDGRSQFLVTKIDLASGYLKIEDSKSPNSNSQIPIATHLYRVEMSEGRNRQIRRTFAALGYTVTALHRTSFGNYSLGDIKTGEHTLVDIS